MSFSPQPVLTSRNVKIRQQNKQQEELCAAITWKHQHKKAARGTS